MMFNSPTSSKLLMSWEKNYNMRCQNNFMWQGRKRRYKGLWGNITKKKKKKTRGILFNFCAFTMIRELHPWENNVVDDVSSELDQENGPIDVERAAGFLYQEIRRRPFEAKWNHGALRTKDSTHKSHQTILYGSLKISGWMLLLSLGFVLVKLWSMQTLEFCFWLW